MTREEVADYEQSAMAEHKRSKKAGKVKYMTAKELRKRHFRPATIRAGSKNGTSI